MSDDFSEPLLEAARGGDERAFRALVEPLGRELHAHAYRMLGGFHDGDDVLQESRINSALQRARATIARPNQESAAIAPRHAEVVDRFVRAWESGDFDDFVKLLASDVVMSMPPWEYWLDGKDAVVATMRSSGTWDGEPRPGRYRIVPASMNGEPGGLAYVLGPDGRYHSVCLTVLSLDEGGRVVELTTFVLPELFAAWGFPPVLEA